MARHRQSTAIWLVAVLFQLTGCGWWGEDRQDEVEDVFPELGAASEIPDSDSDRLGEDGASVEDSHQSGPQFHAGDRFPLLKTVRQTLTQDGVGGVETSRSELNVQMVLSVEEVQNRRTRFGIQYDRVHFSQDVAGETIVYDSNHPPSEIPEAAGPYQGLVYNGFSFWRGPDHRVDELVGFQDFIERCVRYVSPERQETLISELASLEGEDGVVHFVDDSVVLLPELASESQLTAGYSWNRTQHVTHPVPVNLRTQYTVRQVDEQAAEIDILGTISPATDASGRSGGDAGMSLTVRDGHAYGRCTIDRRTGLPVRSELVRLLTMRVRLPGGEEFEQRKETVTTIRSVSQQDLAGSAGDYQTRDLGTDTGGIIPAAASYEDATDPTREFSSPTTRRSGSPSGWDGPNSAEVGMPNAHWGAEVEPQRNVREPSFPARQ